MFPLRLPNFKRDSGMGFIPLKSSVNSNKHKECWISLKGGNSRSRKESAGTNSTVRCYLDPVNRTPTDDPIYGGGNGQGEGR